MPKNNTMKSPFLTTSADYRRLRAERDHKVRSALARAMRKAGHDPGEVWIQAGTIQDSYADLSGWTVASDSPDTCERAARWLAAYLTSQGEGCSTGLWAGGWSARRPIDVYLGSEGESLAGRARLDDIEQFPSRWTAAHARAWVQTGWHSIGD